MPISADEKYQRQLEKQRQAQLRQLERQREKQRARMNDAAYLAAQREKQMAASERQRLRQQERQQQQLADPQFRQQQLEKARSAARRQQHKKLQQPRSDSVSIKPRKAIKSKGLTGRHQTVAEKRLGSRLATLGCICCRNQGWISNAAIDEASLQYVSLHHVEGRTKPWAHAMVLPLCHFHHQTAAPADAPAELFPLHGNAKNRWEKVNGTQLQLLKQVYDMIGEPRPWLETEPA